MNDMQHRTTKRAAAFTLMELLVASTMFVVLAGALYAIFSSALRLREHAYAAIERELPATAALSILRRDLAGMTIPAGTLAGPIQGTANRTGDKLQDTLQFYTTTGRIDEKALDPWAEIQLVNYHLVSSSSANGAKSQELVREVTRNLLATSSATSQQQRLLAGVQGLQFEYLNTNQTWADSWDSAANSQAPPTAVKVHIDLAPAQGDESTPEPIELVCEIAAQPKSADSSTTDTTLPPGGGGGGSGGSGSGGSGSGGSGSGGSGSGNTKPGGTTGAGRTGTR